MPVSVVVGGQYGSEGKGKVALDLVRRRPSTTIVVRPGGTNSGHTAFTRDGHRLVLRQIPAAAIDRNVAVIFPAGSYIDTALLQREIAEVGLPTSRIIIDPRAHVIRKEHLEWERRVGLVGTIGSTGSGTGAAVLSRAARFASSLPPAMQASEMADLLPYLADTVPILEEALGKEERIVIEGTQGFGLSSLHGDAWPKCTSRDTTASAFLSEAGLSPRHVDEVVLVLRCYPIRVAGDSGPLAHETTWESIAAEAGAPEDIREMTSVTQKLRRVGRFDADIVKRSIMVNAPTSIVLNHLDHVDWEVRRSSATTGSLTAKARNFLDKVESSIGRLIDTVGVDPTAMLDTAELRRDLSVGAHV